MNKSFLLLLTILTILSCRDNRPKSDVAHENLIESIKIERYTVLNGNPDSISFSSYIIKDYDKNGNEIKSVYYSTDNSIMMQFVNQYENGNKTRIDWVDAKDTLVKYVKNTYDTDNRLVRSESYNSSNEFQSGFIHQWKNNGRIEEKGPIEEGKEFKPNAIYTYNDQQEFELLTEYDANDSLYATVKWKYLAFDEHNEWIKRHMTTNDTLNQIEKRIIKYKRE
ncbi:hypothetical protein SB49_15775 [Sediminicola sp. YIK13]|uniref:hypothetical protein n=1 Tax=Sediminicola sp. YIK13 TaxID=1453352 RepID=UPI000722F472|nr:hypothetical protein [Sediminicola sp. YIK13]ALM09083.1 hypothetical protein SB49_15775 [Sediminicola sp. YIK13]